MFISLHDYCLLLWSCSRRKFFFFSRIKYHYYTNYKWVVRRLSMKISGALTLTPEKYPERYNYTVRRVPKIVWNGIFPPQNLKFVSSTSKFKMDHPENFLFALKNVFYVNEKYLYKRCIRHCRRDLDSSGIASSFRRFFVVPLFLKSSGVTFTIETNPVFIKHFYQTWPF